MAAKDNPPTVELYVTRTTGKQPQTVRYHGFRRQRHGLRYITRRAICGLSGGPGDQGYCSSCIPFLSVEERLATFPSCPAPFWRSKMTLPGHRTVHALPFGLSTHLPVTRAATQNSLPTLRAERALVTVSNFSVSGNVDAFEWSPTSQLIAYTVNPITGSSLQFRLFVAPPNLENQSFPISNIPAATNAIYDRRVSMVAKRFHYRLSGGHQDSRSQ